MKYIVTIFTVLFFFSCQDLVEIDIPNGNPKLVVEAWFKSDSTSQKVRLSKSVDFSSDVSFIPEQNASVFVTTGGGNRYDFSESEDGYYVMDSTQFIVYFDTVYSLNVVTSDGRVYQSSPQSVKQVPKMDFVLFMSIEVIEEFGFGDFIQDEDGLFASLTTIERPGLGDHYVWKQYQNGVDLSVGNNLFIADDSGLEDGVRIPFQLAWFPEPLETGDTIKIEQMTITEQAHDYFEQLSNQINGGGPFSTPPAPVLGNMFNVDDENELVLGNFILSDVHSIEQIIGPFNTINSIELLETIQDQGNL